MRATSDDLLLFVTVVENGSFSRAAEQLNIATSVVSRSIKKLETRLGVSLLNRTTRQLSLTQEGERYFQRIQKVLQEMRAAEDELIEDNHAPQGNLRVDASTPVMLYLLIPMIKPFLQHYPGITLSLSSSESFINLIERKVDVAIRGGNLHDSTLRARPLFISHRRIVAAPSYIQERGMPQCSEDLNAHQCLGFIETARLNRWPVKTADDRTFVIPPGSSANSGETLKQLCLNGNGIACLSEFMVDKEIAEGKLVQILPEQTLTEEMPFNAVYYSDHQLSPRIRVFIDFLSAYIEKQPWRR
ncbi:LysR family transcriptional regulator [Erwinia sp. OLTSP20]|uniref:DNA-binding transcriptional regulator YafC n=1 Tax=unclassified Erwinia TaxID=2622719 RepID=UPI000C184BC0|nr:MULTISPECIES: DNA-binding transcriptional regulator YafC [unclassified Erwinia]PIJ48400.1 LysR family transcriptional regulator [Erwinia sp. OAMSP11]PIJ67738.1 LysR family transcriptional regulator [Erwinia sp. OLSSP12]PIJ78761.1 LysR family transcriptional regulator [Erwinia sp. OLCASP19]PIJ79421.1 LysR family transcriptional regulator [Erwinia sp. OLMTSP26]PIJ81293.1 LysR family transcriptional regulator [Erwinia sp. OLMDSP33]